jgi:hypothetical protein
MHLETVAFIGQKHLMSRELNHGFVVSTKKP